ncbi:hypothetical protein NDU88_001915 [Pleurodeles waltl]|uniref:Uncharacterized protein n=1 Tax=Pleurodeles waltl TaxID=8319 RepID=A0AAV7VXR3_PLEWA|nr:hypothetical protein NDU88_001915 [Pleurodeles waltl]
MRLRRLRVYDAAGACTSWIRPRAPRNRRVPLTASVIFLGPGPDLLSPQRQICLGLPTAGTRAGPPEVECCGGRGLFRTHPSWRHQRRGECEPQPGAEPSGLCLDLPPLQG